MLAVMVVSTAVYHWWRTASIFELHLGLLRPPRMAMHRRGLAITAALLAVLLFARALLEVLAAVVRAAVTVAVTVAATVAGVQGPGAVRVERCPELGSQAAIVLFPALEVQKTRCGMLIGQKQIPGPL
jgi:hypothetical protein